MKSLFNKIKGSGSNKELIKNIFLLLLVFFALKVVFDNVIAPILAKNDISAYNDDIDMMFEETENNEKEQMIANVEISKIYWNDKPKRDPFSLHILKSNELQNTSLAIDTKSEHANKYRKSKRRLAIAPKLNGIVKGLDSKLAVLNGKIVKVGQVVNGFELLDIMKKQVTMKRKADSKIVTLSLINGGANE